MLKAKQNTWLPSLLGGFLLLEWACVYLIRGRLGALSLQGIMLGSMIGAVIVGIMGVKFLARLFSNKKLDLYEVIMLVLGLMMAYPTAWLINI